MRLIDWQLAFEQHLLSESSVTNSGFAATLLGGPTLDVDTGLAIYHNAYVSRLQEVLRHDFSAIWYWLGDDEFALLTDAYVRRYPSAHYSLRWWRSRARRWPSWRDWSGRLPSPSMRRRVSL
jgi:hypothetical protein